MMHAGRFGTVVEENELPSLPASASLPLASPCSQYRHGTEDHAPAFFAPDPPCLRAGQQRSQPPTHIYIPAAPRAWSRSSMLWMWFPLRWLSSTCSGRKAWSPSPAAAPSSLSTAHLSPTLLPGSGLRSAGAAGCAAPAAVELLLATAPPSGKSELARGPLDPSGTTVATASLPAGPLPSSSTSPGALSLARKAGSPAPARPAGSVPSPPLLLQLPRSRLVLPSRHSSNVRRMPITVAARLSGEEAGRVRATNRIKQCTMQSANTPCCHRKRRARA